MYNRIKNKKDMNNNIIKSLRRTLFCTVAAAAVTIGFTACADDALVTQNTPAPANVGGYKLSIPANMGGGGTRAIALMSQKMRKAIKYISMMEEKVIKRLSSILMLMERQPICVVRLMPSDQGKVGRM